MLYIEPLLHDATPPTHLALPARDTFWPSSVTSTMAATAGSPPEEASAAPPSASSVVPRRRKHGCASQCVRCQLMYNVHVTRIKFIRTSTWGCASLRACVCARLRNSAKAPRKRGKGGVAQQSPRNRQKNVERRPLAAVPPAPPRPPAPASPGTAPVQVLHVGDAVEPRPRFEGVRIPVRGGSFSC